MPAMTQQETYLLRLFKKMEGDDQEFLLRLSATMAARSKRNAASHLSLVAGSKKGGK